MSEHSSQTAIGDQDRGAGVRGKWRRRAVVGVLSTAAVPAGLHAMLRIWWHFKVRNYYRLQEAHRAPAPASDPVS